MSIEAESLGISSSLFGGVRPSHSSANWETIPVYRSTSSSRGISLMVGRIGSNAPADASLWGERRWTKC